MRWNSIACRLLSFPSLMTFVVISIVVISATPAMLLAQEQPKWRGYVEPTGKVGTDRSLGEIDLFVPLWQDQRTLLFGNVRGVIADNSSEEGNFGLGLRRMLDNGWNIGGYGYFDLRSSPENNTFTQATLGVEALSVDWDLRANGYIPVGDTTQSAPGQATASFSGGRLQMRAGQEKALHGFDAEVGYRLPVTAPDDDIQVRVYAGGYHFDASDVESVSGPRARGELRWNNPFGLGENSRLTVLAEGQHDDPRGSQGFFGMRIRVPFGAGGSRSDLTAQERRMTERVQRDVDIVTQSGALGAPENVRNVATGVEIAGEAVAAENLEDAVNEAGENGLIVVAEEDNPFEGGVSLQDGQTLLGGGHTLTLQGVNSGQVVNFTAPGSRPTIFGGGSSEDFVIEAASNTYLGGIDVGPGNTADAGIQAPDGVSNMHVADNRVRNMPDEGLLFEGAAETIRVRDSVIERTGDQGILFDGTATDVAITDTTIQATDGDGIEFDEAADGFLIADSAIRAADDEGILFDGDVSNVSILRNTIEGTEDEAIEVDDEAIGVQIADNTIQGVDDEGIHFDDSSDRVSDIRILRNTIEGINDDEGIEFDSSDTSDVRIADNAFRGVDDEGIHFDGDNATDGATDIEILRNTIDGVGDQAIEFDDNATNVLIADNAIRNAFDDEGIEFQDDASNIEILRNSIENTGDEGIRFEDHATNVLIADNTIRNAFDNDGIEFDDDASDVEILRNTIENFEDEGIEFLGSGASNVRIADNTIRNSSDGDGIEMHSSSNIEILRNTIENVENEGIEFDGDVDGLLISDNVIRNTGDNGIQLGTSGNNTESAVVADNLIDTVGSGDHWLLIDSVSATDVEVTGNTFEGTGGDTVVELGDGTFSGGNNTNDTPITATGDICNETVATGGSGFTIKTGGSSLTCGD